MTTPSLATITEEVKQGTTLLCRMIEALAPFGLGVNIRPEISDHKFVCSHRSLKHTLNVSPVSTCDRISLPPFDMQIIGLRARSQDGLAE